MDIRFPTPVSAFSTELDAPEPLKGFAALLARLPLPGVGARGRRREVWMARREQDVTPEVPVAPPVRPRKPHSGRRPNPVAAFAAATTAPELFGIYASPIPDGLQELQAPLNEMPARPFASGLEVLPAWVTSGGEDRLGRDEGETGEFMQLFARNANSLAELARYE